MKKTRALLLISAVFLLATAAISTFANDTAETWRSIYSRAKTIDQKHEVMLGMIEQNNQELIPVFMEALEELVAQRKSLGSKEKAVREEMMLLIIGELGELRAESAAALIYTVLSETDSAILKRQSLIALGKSGDKSYAPKVAAILAELNTSRGDQPQDEEKIAYGSIVALETFQDPVGYRPIFFTLDAGYSQLIVEAAGRALQKIVRDPAPILKEVIVVEADPKVKLLALEQTYASGASDTNKEAVAIVALEQGLSTSPRNLAEETVLRELRKEAITMLIALKTKEPAAVPVAEKSLYLDTDTEELLYAIQVLGIISSDASVKALLRFLTYQNDRRAEGMPATQERIIIAVLRTLGQTRNRLAFTEVLRTKFVEYSHDVEVEVDKALQNLR